MQATLDRLLRERAPAFEATGKALVAIFLAGGLVHGLVLGSFGGLRLQSVYSALKVPLLFATSLLICLPNFWMVNTLLGLRADIRAAVHSVLRAQVVSVVCLASLAPVSAFGHFTSTSYPFAVVHNGLLFALACLGGQVYLQRQYRELVARDPRHRVALWAWLGLIVFVSIQLTWMLRPFVGDPDLPTTFLRAETWGNAYVKVFDALTGLFGS